MVRISDKDLIKDLKRNSRIPYTELAKKYAVSEGAIRKRIAKLIKQGIIRKFTVDVDPKKLGYEIEALIGIDTAPDKLVEVLDYLKQQEEIEELYTSTGDHMIMLKICFKDNSELIDYVKHLENTPGITRVCPAIILNRVK
ncbi:MAG: Lrp/AsnC family transcriptional regulator [Candidatus Nanohaloarchaeota archaeon]|nr:Lrp/AsnC family transcriptional regulator [Candidatus Nanohaloarchaeota archaeon]